MDELLKKLNLRWDELNSSERDTLQMWLEQMSKRILTLDDVRFYVRQMLDGVEKELADTKAFCYILGFIEVSNPKDVLLKARAKNYILLLAFLDTPDKARKALEQQIEGLAKKGV